MESIAERASFDGGRRPRRARPGVAALLAWALLGAACANDGSIDLLGSGGAAGPASTSTSTSTSTSMTASSTGASTASGSGGGCAAPLESCAGVCVSTNDDPEHCGSCDKGCSHYQYCQGGQCYCRPGMDLCNGSCFDLQSNPDHCGDCNHPCNAGEKCEGGMCLGGTCTTPLTGCPASNGRLACVDIANGFPFCGACDVVCAPTEVCVGDHCQAYEPAGPCAACPCTDECTALLGSSSACCPGLYGGVDPICVANGACP